MGLHAANFKWDLSYFGATVTLIGYGKMNNQSAVWINTNFIWRHDTHTHVDVFLRLCDNLQTCYRYYFRDLFSSLACKFIRLTFTAFTRSNGFISDGSHGFISDGIPSIWRCFSLFCFLSSWLTKTKSGPLFDLHRSKRDAVS